MSEETTLDFVLKRNSRERLKKEKAPLRILDELPSLIDRGYEEISEEDIVRLQWYGLYHDKPKIGEFMLRVRIPNGILSPPQLRRIGEMAEKFGRGFGELTTRQDIQLHSLKLEHLPDLFALMKAVGLSTVGGCGDTVRNITGCPVGGLDRNEVFDVRPVIRELAEFLHGNPDYSDLPRKHKITVAGCPHQCNLPEMHCQAYIAVVRKHEGQEQRGFAVRVGGGLSSVPRISKPMNVFVTVDGVLPLARATVDVWQSDLKYRRSFAKARLKFMIDDVGVEEFRRRVEERLGRKLDDFAETPIPANESNHLGIHDQVQDGLCYVGFPVLVGKVDGGQMIRIAEVMEREQGEIRLTQQQNLILSGIAKNRVDAVVKEAEAIGLSLEGTLRGPGIACTGQPFCNYAVTETKGRLVDIVTHLESSFGPEQTPLRIFLDGCPHACGHHWIGDVGLMGTAGRDAQGEKLEAYDVILRGGRGAQAAVGKPIGRRIPAEQVKFALERLVRAYRTAKESTPQTFQEFCTTRSDQELVTLLNA